MVCQKPFTETDTICGKRKRTTKRFREDLGKKAQQQPIAHVAQAAHVGQRFVQGCFEAVVQEIYAKQGRAMDETTPLSTPCFLGIDEFARRKGHRYDTILCDLVNRTVLEVSEGRALEDVKKLLERLICPDAVKAVSMDMSASFRPAVQKCLPHAAIVVDHFHVIQHVSDPHLRRFCRVGHKERKEQFFCIENNTSS
jgi:transposase